MLNRRFGSAFTFCLGLTAIAGVPDVLAADMVTDWGTKSVAISAEKQLPNARYTRGLAMICMWRCSKR
jgi:hypothetical protein